jgi:hypothetical protein
MVISCILELFDSFWFTINIIGPANETLRENLHQGEHWVGGVRFERMVLMTDGEPEILDRFPVAVPYHSSSGSFPAGQKGSTESHSCPKYEIASPGSSPGLQ